MKHHLQVNGRDISKAAVRLLKKWEAAKKKRENMEMNEGIKADKTFRAEDAKAAKNESKQINFLDTNYAKENFIKAKWPNTVNS